MKTLKNSKTGEIKRLHDQAAHNLHIFLNQLSYYLFP